MPTDKVTDRPGLPGMFRNLVKHPRCLNVVRVNGQACESTEQVVNPLQDMQASLLLELGALHFH
jgi:hypothetical protein